MEAQSFNKITDIHVDQKGNIWFVTADDDVKRYDGKSLKRFTAAEVFGSEMNSSQLDYLRIIFDYLRIFEDRQGNLWFAGWQAIIKYDGVSFQSFPVDINVPPVLIHQDIHDAIAFIYTRYYIRYEGGGGISSLDPRDPSSPGHLYPAVGRYDGKNLEFSRLDGALGGLPIGGSKRPPRIGREASGSQPPTVLSNTMGRSSQPTRPRMVF